MTSIKELSKEIWRKLIDIQKKRKDAKEIENSINEFRKKIN